MDPSGISLLRFLTCGSVDDGKSTLIGRLLVETGNVADDQLAALRADSRKAGWPEGQLDCSLLLDGLTAEREQGITIDVAYRYFATARRKYIVADTPGHEQYTRNMVTGASTADLAIVLVDAGKGLLDQTRRHSVLVAMLGIRQVVLAVSKMDRVGYAQTVFEAIHDAYSAFAARIDLGHVTAIPVSGLHGDNVVGPSARMPWYEGPALMPWLEAVPLDEAHLQTQPLRLPVQWINRTVPGERGLAGTLVAGSLQAGERVCVLPSGVQSTVRRISCGETVLDRAVANQSVTVTLDDAVDVSRGDLLCTPAAPAPVADRFEATLVWMSEQPLLPGRSYLIKIGTRSAVATVMPLKHRIDIVTLAPIAASTLALNEIGVAAIELDRPVAFDPYADNRDTGGFILIDRLSNATAGAGMLKFALRRADNLHWQATDVDKSARCALNGHRCAAVWLTGLSGAGKSSLANRLEQRLHVQGMRTYLLDGDNVRLGLNKDLGFTSADRVENVRRVAEVARLMVDAGLLVIVALISPFRVERRMARELFAQGEFVEVFCDVPLAVAEQRDPKGLYRKARAGALKNFTGIDSPYEAPRRPELHLDMSRLSADEAAEAVFQHLSAAGLLDAPVR
jgi:bifunctional enzyme CysN/CysC